MLSKLCVRINLLTSNVIHRTFSSTWTKSNSRPSIYHIQSQYLIRFQNANTQKWNILHGRSRISKCSLTTPNIRHTTKHMTDKKTAKKDNTKKNTQNSLQIAKSKFIQMEANFSVLFGTQPNHIIIIIFTQIAFSVHPTITCYYKMVCNFGGTLQSIRNENIKRHKMLIQININET